MTVPVPLWDPKDGKYIMSLEEQKTPIFPTAKTSTPTPWNAKSKVQIDFTTPGALLVDFEGGKETSQVGLFKKEDEAAIADKSQEYTPYAPQQEELLPREEWLRAVIQGADERSSRWKHVIAHERFA